MRSKPSSCVVEGFADAPENPQNVDECSLLSWALKWIMTFQKK